MQTIIKVDDELLGLRIVADLVVTILQLQVAIAVHLVERAVP